jgi:hypothetical protein
VVTSGILCMLAPLTYFGSTPRVPLYRGAWHQVCLPFFHCILYNHFHAVKLLLQVSASLSPAARQSSAHAPRADLTEHAGAPPRPSPNLAPVANLARRI